MKTNNASVVLIGMTGCGKTTVGRLAAARLGCSFADLDEEIERGESRTVRDIFDREGEDAFRVLETEYLRRLTARGAGETLQIIACGGGAPLRPETRAVLSGLRTVWIRRRPELVLRSPAVLSRPPLCGSREKYYALLAAREPLYRAAAQCVLDSEDAAETAEALCRWIGTQKQERK